MRVRRRRFGGRKSSAFSVRRGDIRATYEDEERAILCASRGFLEYPRRRGLPVLPGCTCDEIAQSLAIDVAACARFVDFAHMKSTETAADSDAYSAGYRWLGPSKRLYAM